MNEDDRDRIIAYSDASFSDDYATGRSTNGVIIKINGGPVIWKSVCMQFVVTSSTHAEYAAMSEAVFSIGYARGILCDLVNATKLENIQVLNTDDKALDNVQNACKSDDPAVELRVDNLAAIHIGTHDVSSKRSRHINMRFMCVREAVLGNVIYLIWVSTEDQVADILTKCLGVSQFKRIRDMVLIERKI